MRSCEMLQRLVFALITLVLIKPDFAWCSTNWGLSARASGMGNAFVAAVGDPSALFCNPAGLVRIPTWRFSVHYTRESRYDFGEGESPFTACGILVVPLQDRMSVAVCGLKNGSWADHTGVVTRNLEGLGFAAQVNRRLAVGMSAKSIHNSNYGNTRGEDLDLGALFQATADLRLGMAVQNLLAADVRSEAASRPEPSRAVKAGFVYRIERFRGEVAFDLALNNVAGGTPVGDLQSNLGMEKQILETGWLDFKLRAGCTLGRENGQQIRQPSVGWGVVCRGARSVCEVDYSWQGYPYETSETSVGDHRISITIYPRIPKSQDKLTMREGTPYVHEPRKPDETDFSSFASDDHQMRKFPIRAEQILIGKDKYLLFLAELEPGIRVSRWQLCIYSQYAGSHSGQEPGLQLVNTIEGCVMPAGSILWDMKIDGTKPKPGKYLYRLEVSTPQGESRKSESRSFTVR